MFVLAVCSVHVTHQHLHALLMGAPAKHSALPVERAASSSLPLRGGRDRCGRASGTWDQMERPRPEAEGGSVSSGGWFHLNAPRSLSQIKPLFIHEEIICGALETTHTHTHTSRVPSLTKRLRWHKTPAGPTVGGPRPVQARQDVKVPAPDGFCGVIYDPGGELKFSCPPQTELSDETDALFIIKAAKKSQIGQRESLNPPQRQQEFCLFLWKLEPVPGLISAGVEGRAAFVL